MLLQLTVTFCKMKINSVSLQLVHIQAVQHILNMTVFFFYFLHHFNAFSVLWNWQMSASVASVCWILLAVILSLSSFGLYGCFWIAAAAIAFIAGYGSFDITAQFVLCKLAHGNSIADYLHVSGCIEVWMILNHANSLYVTCFCIQNVLYSIECLDLDLDLHSSHTQCIVSHTDIITVCPQLLLSCLLSWVQLSQVLDLDLDSSNIHDTQVHTLTSSLSVLSCCYHVFSSQFNSFTSSVAVLVHVCRGLTGPLWSPSTCVSSDALVSFIAVLCENTKILMWMRDIVVVSLCNRWQIVFGPRDFRCSIYIRWLITVVDSSWVSSGEYRVVLLQCGLCEAVFCSVLQNCLSALWTYAAEGRQVDDGELQRL